MSENKWLHVTKYVNGLSAEDYFEIKDHMDYLLDEERADAFAEDWALDVNKDGMHNGFSYTNTVVDKPPLTWVIKKIDRIEREQKINYDMLITLGKLYKQQ